MVPGAHGVSGEESEAARMTDELSEKIETAIMGVFVGVLWLVIYYLALFA